MYLIAENNNDKIKFPIINDYNTYPEELMMDGNKEYKFYIEDKEREKRIDIEDYRLKKSFISNNKDKTYCRNRLVSWEETPCIIFPFKIFNNLSVEICIEENILMYEKDGTVADEVRQDEIYFNLLYEKDEKGYGIIYVSTIDYIKLY